jgi:hypothetical protein
MSIKINNMIINSSSSKHITFTYPGFENMIDYNSKMVTPDLNMAIYRDLEQFGIHSNNVKEISFNNHYKYMIAILEGEQ